MLNENFIVPFYNEGRKNAVEGMERRPWNLSPLPRKLTEEIAGQ